MKMEERDDMVWKTFVKTAKVVAPKIPIEFLSKIYEIQQKHQFSLDSSESLQLMERLIDEFVGGIQ